VLIARTVARNTSHRAERVSRGLTWGADEKILFALAVAGWVATRGRSEHLQRVGNYPLLVTVAASLIPHGLKSVFNQTRPDRTTVLGHLHGVSFSGKRKDAFASGHALHMGALASAAGTLPPLPRRAIRTVAIGLSLTRIVVLAHWASDVVAGFALGAVMERLLRLWTGYRLQSSEESDANP
jgi:undecaprenyl-diphosphatase